MGKQLLDQYSVLHWASGVIAYFWNVPFQTWLAAHIAFEFVENTEPGMRFINTSLKSWWPGGKPSQDEFINIVGDNASAMFGWYCASKLDKKGKDEDWYNK